MVHVQGLEGSRDFCKKWSGDSNWSGSGEGSCEDSKHVMSHVVITTIMCLVMWNSAPCWEGKQLSSNVTSLDSLTERVCLSHSWYPFEPGSYPTSMTSIAFASNLHHLSMGTCMYPLHLKTWK